MANLDTAAKRFSGIYPLCPWRGANIVPTGTVNQAERQASAFVYSGILANAPAAATLKGFLLILGAGQIFALLLMVLMP